MPLCSVHGSGSVPMRKISRAVCGQDSPASLPLDVSMLAVVIPGGTANGGAGYASSAYFMNCVQIGSAAAAPLRPWGSPSSKPTQTAATRRDE